MHGVSCCSPKENPVLIAESLEKLEQELESLPDTDNEMYLMSQALYDRKDSTQADGSYVNDKAFRLRFLRTELFDPSRAAMKMASFLNVVGHLFGEYALQRPIRLSDFTEEEMQAFRTGNLQLLPFRDRSGRRIIVGVEGLAIQFASKTRVRL